MISLLMFAVILVALANSCLILLSGTKSYDALMERYPAIKHVFFLTLYVAAGVTFWQIGAVGREEVSSLPWEVWLVEVERSGAFEAMYAVVISLIFLLWILIVPGHIYSQERLLVDGKRRIYPYVINVIIGVILCVPANPIYTVIESMFVRW